MTRPKKGTFKCRIFGCGYPVNALGLCRKHYQAHVKQFKKLEDKCSREKSGKVTT